MRSKLILAWMATLLFVVLMPIRGGAQEPTPTPGDGGENRAECGPNTEAYQNIPLPDGVTVLYACAIVTFPVGETNLTAGTTTRIDPNTNITSAEGVNLRQTGTVSITVISGSLTVNLIKLCSESMTCTDGSGTAQLGTFDANNNLAFTDLALNTPIEVTPGQMIVLHDVTVTYSTGASGAVIAATGTYDLNPGSGCVLSCFQFP